MVLSVYFLQSLFISIIDILLLIVDILFMPEWLTDTKLMVYADPSDFKKYFGKEHSFCIMNHTYEIDWLINWMLCSKIGCLGVSK